MQSIGAIVLILGNVRLHSINGKSAILDPVGISTHDGAKEGVVRLGVFQVPSSLVVADRHVLRVAILVVDHETGQSCSVRNKSRTDAICAQLVFLERVAGEGRKRRSRSTAIAGLGGDQCRCSENCSPGGDEHGAVTAMRREGKRREGKAERRRSWGWALAEVLFLLIIIISSQGSCFVCKERFYIIITRGEPGCSMHACSGRTWRTGSLVGGTASRGF